MPLLERERPTSTNFTDIPMPSSGNTPDSLPATDDDMQCAIQAGVNLLISGGSPKERAMLARTIHTQRCGSEPAFRRHDCWPMCTADIESLLGQGGHAGSRYFDHVGALNPQCQAVLCRFLEASHAGCVIAGTGDDLAAAVAAGTFDATLFYRLNVIHLVIPANVPRPTLAGRGVDRGHRLLAQVG